MVLLAIEDFKKSKGAESRQRAQLKRRRLEAEVVARIATNPHLANGEVKELASVLTEMASAALQVERVGVWLFDETGTQLVNIDNYTASTGTHSSGDVLLAHEYRDEFEALKKAIYIDAHDALSDPRVAGYVESYLKPHRIVSMLDVAVRAEGRNLGVLCLEQVDKPRQWQPEEIAFGRQLADQVALSLMHRDRKRAEEALRESERNYREIFNATNEAIFINDAATGRMLDVNDAMLRMYGYDSKEKVLAGNIGDLSANEPPYTEEEAQRRIRLAIEQCPQIFEWLARKRNGENFWVEVSMRSTSIGGKNRVLAVVRDIGERKQAEEALRRSQFLLNESQSLAHLGSWELDLTTNHLTWSDEVYRIFGLEPQEFAATYHAFLERVHPDDRAAVDEAYFGSVRAGKDTYEIEHRVVKKDTGAIRYVHEKCVHVKSASGKITRSIGMVHDITERKQAEERLRLSEERFRALFEQAGVGVAVIETHTGRFVQINQKYCDIVGYSADEMLRATFQAITHPDDLQADLENMRRLREGRMRQFSMEKRYYHKDGRVVWVNLTVTPLWQAGEPTEFHIAVVEDITEHKRAEEERNRLATAIEQAGEAVIITGPDARIQYVNPAFEKITGYTRHDALGRTPRFLKSGKQDAEFYRRMWAMLTAGEVWSGHLVNKKKDGTLYDEEKTISPVLDSNGRLLHYVAVARDITREKQLEEMFRQAQKMEAVGRLAGGVAHDFNNILAAILMQAELLIMNDNLSPGIKDELRQIHASAERAVNLTRQLLMFSRKQVMQARNLDLNDVVVGLSKMLQRIIGEDIKLELNLHEHPLPTHADPGMLDQVLMNLAVNARDAMTEGGRLIIATSEQALDEEADRMQPDAVPGRYVCLSITDTGCGIPEDILPHLFEPFFTTKEPGEGTGLGLATVYGIVKQHRGRITVDSMVGRGTTFRILLPALEIERTVEEEAQSVVQPKPRAGSETILLVEDDEGVGKLIRTILERHGYRVLEAPNAAEALKIWKIHGAAVALMLTDIVMPGGMSGRDLARLLRAERPELKVIYLSGYSPELAGLDLVLEPGQNFLQKPISSQVLLETVRRSLGS